MAASDGETEYKDNAARFIHEDFYADDDLTQLQVRKKQSP